MFSAYIAAEPETANHWSQYLSERPERALLVGRTATLDTALSECLRDAPGVLLLDDALLAEGDPLDRLLQLTCPIVLIGPPQNAAAARHALALKAKDFLTHDNWREELWTTLDRVAISLYPRDRKSGRIFAIFSPKGGVGKTTLAVNLAVALASRHHEPVAVVDLDLSFGDVAPMLNLNPTATMHDVMMHQADPAVLDQAMTETDFDVDVLAAPQAPDQAEDIQLPSLVRILRALREQYTYTVLDLAPGYQETNVAALDISDRVLTLCTPDVVTLRALGQALALFRDTFRYPGEKIRVVLNRTRSGTGIEPSDVTAILKVPRVDELPSAGSLPVRAANQGLPFVRHAPAHPLARAIAQLADDLADQGTVSARSRLRKSRR